MTGYSVRGALRWMMLAKGASQVVSWLVTLVVIRILTPADYGLFAMAAMLVLLAEMMKELGLGSALVQAKEATPLLLRQVFTIIVAFNVLLYLLVSLLAPVMVDIFDEDALDILIPVLALQFPITAMETVPDAMLSRNMDFRTKAIIAMLGALGNALVTLTLAMAGFGIWALIFGNLAAGIVRVLSYTIVQQVIFVPATRYDGIGRIVSFGGFVTLSRFLNVLLIQSSFFVVGRILGKEALGIYSVANQLATLPMQKVSGILNEVGLAAFSRIQENRSEVSQKYVRAMTILAFISFPVFWGLASVAEPLVDVFLGPKWAAIVLPLQMIAAITPLRMIFNTSTPAVLGIGRADLFFKNLVVLNLLMPVAAAIGTAWGVNGVVIAWFVAYPPVFAVLQGRYLKALDVSAADLSRGTAASCAIALIMLVTIVLAHRIPFFENLPSVVVLAILVLLGAGLYFGSSYRFNREQFGEFRSMIVN